MKLDPKIDLEVLQFMEKVSQCQLNRGLESGSVKVIGIVCYSEMGNVTAQFPVDPELPIFIWQNLGGCVEDSGGPTEMVAASSLSNVIV